MALSVGRGEDPGSRGVDLLKDIRECFGCEDRKSTAEVLMYLNNMADRPWPYANRGRPLNPHGLARLLKPFGIRSRDIRQHGLAGIKGFYIDTFADAWERYLPPSSGSPSSNSATPLQPIESSQTPAFQSATEVRFVADKNQRIPHRNQGRSDVADECPPGAGERVPMGLDGDDDGGPRQPGEDETEGVT
jgi:hypothetical protein